MKKNRRFFHGNGGFFIGMPSRKGPDTEGEYKAILRMGGNMMSLRNFYCLIIVLTMAAAAKASIATFEDLNLPPESYWNGSDGSGAFTSAGLQFNNLYDSTYKSWEGFSYSNITDNIMADIAGQYNAVPGTGQGGTTNYAVCFVGWTQIPTVTFNTAGFVYGLYVTNNNTTYYSMLNGGMIAKKFGGFSGNDPDWLLLTITGKDTDGTITGTVDFYLADYRFADNSVDYIGDSWEYIDLSSLGQVKSMEFNLSSSDVGDWGMNTPAYFALDTIIYQSELVNARIYTEAGINGYINPLDPRRSHASPQDPDAVINPIFKGWATEVVDYYQTPRVASQWSDPNKTLGPATGNVNDIFSLGDLSREQINQGESPGWIILTFDEPIRNNRGYDFAVFENGLLSEFNTPSGSVAGQILAELAYVEVSSNGVDFVRFPSVSLTDQPGDLFSTIEMSHVYNLAGKHPNAYNICTGTPFDLQEIESNPMVISGLVDINDIKYVRIVDIPGTGDFYDDAVEYIDPSTWPEWDYYRNNHPIFDEWNTSLVPLHPSGGFDLEAVGVLKEQKYSADIDLNGVVDMFDFDLFASAWHRHFGEDGWLGRCDLAEPKDLFIGDSDFAVFVSQWLKSEQWRD
jgi:hypothetical protein